MNCHENEIPVDCSSWRDPSGISPGSHSEDQRKDSILTLAEVGEE